MTKAKSKAKSKVKKKAVKPRPITSVAGSSGGFLTSFGTSTAGNI